MDGSAIMNLLGPSLMLRALVACNDETFARNLKTGLLEARSGPPDGTEIALAESPEGEADLLFVEIGGEIGLELLRENRDRYPVSALVVACRESDAALADAAMQHSADDVVYESEFQPRLLRRVAQFAVERNGLTRQLVAAREREAQLSTHDSVTGLAGRSLLFTCVKQAIAFAARQNTGLAIATIDIRGLNGFNRQFGFRAGDKILGAVAERILDAIRTSDMAGRLGGDEFFVLLRDLSAPGGAGQAVENILKEIARPLYVAGHKISVEARAGIAYFPLDAADPDELAARAQDALDTARRSAKSYAYYVTDHPVPAASVAGGDPLGSIIRRGAT